MRNKLSDLITCVKFQNVAFKGFDFTVVRIFHFPINFCTGLKTLQRIVSDVDSGGTVVTVFGNHFNSVAEPRVTLTVTITRLNNDTILTSSKTETNSGVNVHTFR